MRVKAYLIPGEGGVSQRPVQPGEAKPEEGESMPMQGQFGVGGRARSGEECTYIKEGSGKERLITHRGR